MKIYLYVLNTLADWEIGFITAEINSKRYFKDKNTAVEIITVGTSENSITTMGGISIQPKITIDQLKLEQEDLLILPGADTWLAEEHIAIITVATERIQSNLKVAAICGATIALANAVAFNNIKHTSNDKDYLKMVCPNYTGELLYQNNPAFTDGNVVTASGLAPLEFTYEILKLLDVFKPETLEAWYKLYSHKEARYFYELLSSLE